MSAALVLAVLAATAGWRGVASWRTRRITLDRLAGRPTSAHARRRRLVGVGVAAAVSFVLGGPVLAVLVAAGAAATPVVRARRRRHRAADAEVDGLADVVDALAAAFRSGTPPVMAVRGVAQSAPPRLADELRDVAIATERGLPLATAFDRWAASSAREGPALVAAAVAVTASTGGDPSRSLAGVADTLRERRALRREVRALSSQARLSAMVIGVAPAAFGALAVGTDRTTAAFLLRTPAGAACLLAGLGLELAGWRWMDRITRSVS